MLSRFGKPVLAESLVALKKSKPYKKSIPVSTLLTEDLKIESL